MKAYSMDLRRRVLAACDAGHGTSEVARRFDVSTAWVRRLKQRRREVGSIAPRRAGGDQRSVFDDHGRRWLKQTLERQPDLTLEQLRHRGRVELGVVCSVMAISRTLTRLGWSFKKRHFEPASKIDVT